MWFDVRHAEIDYLSETGSSLIELASFIHPLDNAIFGQLAQITTRQRIVHRNIILVLTIW
jgi:hypothetical protein